MLNGCTINTLFRLQSGKLLRQSKLLSLANPIIVPTAANLNLITYNAAEIYFFVRFGVLLKHGRI